MGTYISRSEAAQRAGVTERTIDRWIRTGKLTQHRTQVRQQLRTIYIDPDELKALTRVH